MDAELRASLLAGLAGGLVALAGFAALHAVIVGPDVGLILLSAGLAPGLVAGALAGWAYHEATGAFEPPFRGLGLGAMLWVATLPAGAAGAIEPAWALGVGAPLGLVVAAGLGWFVGRTRRAVAAVVLGAALPVLLVAAGARVVGGGLRELVVLAAMLPILLAAGATLQAARLRLSRRARAR